MEYNIFNGFFDRDKNNELKPNKEREQAAKKIVNQEKPDILILTEADHTKNKNFKQNYKEIFNYPHGVFASKPLAHRDFGIGILSKYPIVKHKTFLFPKSRWIKTSIKIKKKIIHLDAIHPNPHNTQKEKENLFKKLVNKKENPYIVGGDFNAISPYDKYDKKSLLNNFTKKLNNLEKANKIVKEIIKTNIIRFLIKKGLKDTYKEKNKKQDYSYHTQLSGNNYMRIDYILCSKDFKIISSGIIKNELAEKASDHYPIYAVLELND